MLREILTSYLNGRLKKKKSIQIGIQLYLNLSDFHIRLHGRTPSQLLLSSKYSSPRSILRIIESSQTRRSPRAYNNFPITELREANEQKKKKEKRF